MFPFLTFVVMTLLLFSSFSRTQDDLENESSRPQLFVALKLAKESFQNIRKLYLECENQTRSDMSNSTCFPAIGTRLKAYMDVTLDIIKMVVRKYLKWSAVRTGQEPSETSSNASGLGPIVGRSFGELGAGSREREEPDEPSDCLDVLRRGGRNGSGVHSVAPRHPRSGRRRRLDVYCDMDTDGGGWTVIQRRGNFTPQERFFRSWRDYKRGFGNITKDFWIGNENIYILTNQEEASEARFDLEDVNGEKAYAVYSNFRVDGEWNEYQLEISGYAGNAGDSMSRHSGLRFSTAHRSNDLGSGEYICAVLGRAGWWYGDCSIANLNGVYEPGRDDDLHKHIFWNDFRGYECLRATEVKVRRAARPSEDPASREDGPAPREDDAPFGNASDGDGESRAGESDSEHSTPGNLAVSTPTSTPGNSKESTPTSTPGNLEGSTPGNMTDSTPTPAR